MTGSSIVVAISAATAGSREEHRRLGVTVIDVGVGQPLLSVVSVSIGSYWGHGWRYILSSGHERIGPVQLIHHRIFVGLCSLAPLGRIDFLRGMGMTGMVAIMGRGTSVCPRSTGAGRNRTE